MTDCNPKCPCARSNTCLTFLRAEVASAKTYLREVEKAFENSTDGVDFNRCVTIGFAKQGVKNAEMRLCAYCHADDL